MKNITHNTIQFMLIFLLCMGLVFAAGSSAGGSGSYGNTPADSATPPQPDKNASAAKSAPNCESYSTVQERVKCRLMYGETSYSIPEPCRGLPNEKACAQLYTDVTPCYSRSGAEKDKCLKQIAGFSSAALSSESSKPAVRNYILFLLYDLQDRVEMAYADNRISADQASVIIDSIVSAKYAVNRGQSSQDIKSKVAVVKQKYNLVIS